MATKIRLKRIGRRNRPFYRVVVMDERSRRDGAAIEELGWYNPLEKDIDKLYLLKEDRILHWLKEGAQTTDTAHNLLRRAGIAYRWHLIKQGLDEKAVEQEMKKWTLEREEVVKRKATKKSQKADSKKKEAEVEEPVAVAAAGAEKEEPVAETKEVEAAADTKEAVVETVVGTEKDGVEAVAVEDSKEESSEEEVEKESEPKADTSGEEKTAEVAEEPA
ncbi:MAG: 30S ribosomal protein S16, partial [Candidatus Marinimicrobia bacterium]|nr:30S ribosomal protein S16 [Candidatus Neomarinimicrobiota bacterium]